MAKANKRFRSYHRSDDERSALTPIEYSGLQAAFDHFNRELFDRSLPDIFITYQRKARSAGSFSSDEFSGRRGNFSRDGVRLNPDVFVGQTDAQILQNLVHQMCHAWQQHHGKPSAHGYHNRQWADKMKSIGLQPTTTGGVGGKETGARISDYVIPDGPFARARRMLTANGWHLNLQSAPREGPKDRVANSKTKFTCSACGQNAWGKPDLEIICKPCGIQMRAVARPVSSLSYEIIKPPELIKRKRGRPKGSKNKPKDTNHMRNFRTRKLGHTAPRRRGQAGIEGAP
jgi:predicted SprT family Zn-dependent metalloprotease